MSTSFTDFYRAVHGRPPFPWQERLAAREELPGLIDVPTGCGKTSVLDVLVWRSLARGEARRVVWVVDRRLVVDDVHEHAQKVAAQHGLRALKWRGGITLDESWLLEPHERSIIVSTVDQVGSRLLFRGYGVPWKSRSVYAGLLAFDSVVVLDEVHLSRPFAATLERVAALAPPPDRQLGRRLPPPLRVIQMSATPVVPRHGNGGPHGSGGASVVEPLRLEEEDRAHPVLARRLRTRKRAALLKAGGKAGDFRGTVISAARDLARRESVGVVGVVVNRVDDARAVFEALRADEEAILLTGRIRPYDRELLLTSPELRRARAGRQRAQDRPTLFVVATQTIEVGVDLDFDALVTEAAPITPLRQRFGRLDRLGDLGETKAAIVLRPGSERDDPIYGDDLGATWAWMWSVAEQGREGGRILDLGLAAEHDWTAIPSSEEGDSPPPGASLDPSHCDWLAETHPYLDADLDVAALLHGERDEYQRVSLVWRRELNQAPSGVWGEVVDQCPPVRAEALALPRNVAREWLAHHRIDALRWRPGEEGRVVDAATFASWREIRHEEILVIPSRYRGNDAWGWNPDLPRRAPGEDEDQDVGFDEHYMTSEAFRGLQRVVQEPGQEPEAEPGPGRFQPYPVEWSVPGGIVDHRPRRDGTASRESLRSHSAKARAEGERILTELGLRGDNRLADDVLLALRDHDLGKLERRFQVMLRDGDEIATAAALAEEEYLAKSGTDWWNRAVRKRAWTRSGLPTGWRHEVESALRADLRPARNPELVRHLVLAHHGRGRPWLPATGQGLHPIDQANRFWRMQRDHGPWTLGYLEALVVIADRRASEDPNELADAPAIRVEPPPEPRATASPPVVDLAFRGNTFLGFLAALGVLRLLRDHDVGLSWSHHGARLHGLDREALPDALREALATTAFDPRRTQRDDDSRLPWDLCGAGRVQLPSTLPPLREELCHDPERLQRTLFGPWRWQDRGDALGWVPSMRDHALRPRAPTKDSPYRENGPFWLAWEGIAVFGKRPDRDEAVAWYRDAERRWTLAWPLWEAPASLCTVRSLLRSTPRRHGDLGASEWWQTTRMKTRGRSHELTVPRPVSAAELAGIRRRADRK